MADFDGGVFVGIDSSAFGDGSSNTRFLDSMLEASLRGQEYYNLIGYDEWGWDAHVGLLRRDRIRETRPRTSLEWSTMAPPIWIPILPTLEAIEIKGDYAVGDDGTSSTEDFDCRFDLVGLGSHSFTLDYTHDASVQWAPFDETLNVRSPQNLIWTQLQFWGRGRIGTTIASGDADPNFHNQLIDRSTLYSAGTGTAPNSTQPECQVSGVFDEEGNVVYFDHIHYKALSDSMAVNPPLLGMRSPDEVRTISISYLQLRALTVRMRYRMER